MKSKLGAKLLLLIGSVTVMLGVAEVCLRLLADPPPENQNEFTGSKRRLYQHDSLLGWRAAPNVSVTLKTSEYTVSVSNNAEGRRHGDRDLEGDAACRVVAIGDSFVAGYSVEWEETVGRVLERELNRAGGCRVIALGTEAYSTDQELLLYRAEAERLDPDITVLFFYQNDIVCNTRYRCPTPKPVFEFSEGVLALRGVPVPEPEVGPSVPTDTARGGAGLRVKQWLNDHVVLYNLAYRALLRARAAEADSAPLPGRLLVSTTPYNDEYRNGWERTEALLQEFARAVDHAGSRFVVFYVPFRAAVEGDEWSRWHARAAVELPGKSWHRDRVELELGGVCSRLGLDCVLPTERFREYARAASDRLYFERDIHWTREGHALTARILAEHLQRRYPDLVNPLRP